MNCLHMIIIYTMKYKMYILKCFIWFQNFIISLFIKCTYKKTEQSWQLSMIYIYMVVKGVNSDRFFRQILVATNKNSEVI